jgi:hypothetical protein
MVSTNTVRRAARLYDCGANRNRIMTATFVRTSAAQLLATAVVARGGRPFAAVQFVNCRHGFGESLKFDAIVNGVYPDRKFSLWLSQPAEVYKGVELRAPAAYFSIPFSTVECAEAVVNAITSYHLCDVFRKGEPITVYACWENAPDTVWQINN